MAMPVTTPVPGDKAAALVRALVALMERNDGDAEQGQVSVEDIDGRPETVRVRWAGVAIMPRAEIEALLGHPIGPGDAHDSEASD